MPQFPFVIRSVLPITLLSLCGDLGAAEEQALQPDPALQQCLVESLATAGDEVTIGQLKLNCAKRLATPQMTADHQTSDTARQAETVELQERPEATPESQVDKRIALEQATVGNPFALTPHKQNYVLPVTYNHNVNEKPFQDTDERGELDETELKFQISFKVPVWEGIFGEGSSLYAAYTAKSWWQAYNRGRSSPFRETNHEPELFAGFATDWRLGDWTIPAVTAGVVHQSNGRGSEQSRSWNRIYANLILEKDNWVVSFKPWYRIPEDEKDDPSDPDGDDNPDIERYMGHFELTAHYSWGKSRIGAMVRNNLRSDNKGAVQLDWSFPIGKEEKLHAYIQYFNGYGESLIDYNASVSRIGVGFIFTDWL